jgi:L-threonylcarbamoyladenylate synthase
MIKVINDINDITSELIANAVLLYPTETVYGLGCSLYDQNSIDKIGQIKGRALGKQYIRLTDSVDRVMQYIGEVSPSELALFNSDIVVTLLFRPNDDCPREYLHPVDQLFAVRKTSHPICTKLISLLDAPLVSTSANKNGDLPVFDFASMDAHIHENSDIVIISDNSAPSAPSTMVRYNHALEQFEIIRQGSTSLEQIEDFLKTL